LISAAYAVMSKYYDMFHFRYLIFVLPMLFIAIGAGIDTLIGDGVVGVIRGKALSFRGLQKHGYARLLRYISRRRRARPLYRRERIKPVAYYHAEHQGWRAAFEYIEKQALPGDAVVLQGIADSSVRYYAATSGREMDFIGTNRISESADVFAVERRKWFVYYRGKWGKKWFERSQKFLDTLAAEEKTFPGLYGDVVVGFSDAHVVVNELSIFFLPAPAGEKQASRKSIH